jgi:hypothetical protein
MTVEDEDEKKKKKKKKKKIHSMIMMMQLPALKGAERQRRQTTGRVTVKTKV